MKLRLIHCPGSGRDTPHSFAVQGDARPRCSRCMDVAYTDTVDGMVLSYNVDGRLVDRKPVKRATEPERTNTPAEQAANAMTAYTVLAAQAGMTHRRLP